MKVEDSEVKQNFYKANRTKWRFTNTIYFIYLFFFKAQNPYCKMSIRPFKTWYIVYYYKYES